MGYLRRGATDLLGPPPSKSFKWAGDWEGLTDYTPTVIDLSDGKVPSVLSYVPITRIPMTVDASMWSTALTNNPDSASLTTTVASTTLVGIRGSWANGPFTATLDGATFPARHSQANSSYTHSTLFAAKNVASGSHTATFTGGLLSGLAWTSLIALTGVDPETATYGGNNTATFSVALPAGAAGYVLLYTQVNGGTHPVITSAGGLTWTSLGSASYDGQNSSTWWIASYDEAQAGTTISLTTNLDIYGHNQVAVFPQAGDTGANPFLVVADSATPGATPVLANALQTPDIADGEVASATLRVTTPSVGGFVEFHRRVSAEAADKAEFLVDGELKYSVGGESPWEHLKYDLAPGKHTLVWRFVKNASVSSGLDAMRLAGIRVDATPSVIYKQGDVVRQGGRAYRALRTNSNSVPVEGADWTIVSEGGILPLFRDTWVRDSTYKKGEIVTLLGNAYVASEDIPANDAPPSPQEAPLKTYYGNTATYSSWLAKSLYQYFTPTKNLQIHGLTLYVISGETFTISLQTAAGATIASKSMTSVAYQHVEATFDAPVDLVAGTEYRVSIPSIYAATTFGAQTDQSVTMGALTDHQGVVQGGHTALVRLVNSLANKWHSLSGPTSFNSKGTAVALSDILDSFIVGSDQMDHDPNDNTKNSRAFFNKEKYAFRAGLATSEWNDSNVGIGSVALGYSNYALGYYSASLGANNYASGHASFTAGQYNYATAQWSSGVGYNNYASGSCSVAHGREANAHRQGQRALSSGYFSGHGDAQRCEMVVRRITTDATSVVLTANNDANIHLSGESTNVLTIPTNRAFKVKIDVIARRTDVAGEAAGWTFEGVIARDGGAARFVAGGLAISTWADVAAGSWDLTPTIHSNGYLALTATGEAAKTIRWVANIEWVEVG